MSRANCYPETSVGWVGGGGGGEGGVSSGH